MLELASKLVLLLLFLASIYAWIGIFKRAFGVKKR